MKLKQFEMMIESNPDEAIEVVIRHNNSKTVLTHHEQTSRIRDGMTLKTLELWGETPTHQLWRDTTAPGLPVGYMIPREGKDIIFAKHTGSSWAGGDQINLNYQEVARFHWSGDVMSPPVKVEPKNSTHVEVHGTRKSGPWE